MEFTRLVAPKGPLGTAWLAAHWERRLRRHHYVDADVRQICSVVVTNLIGIVSLRPLGHLLVGACRILLHKAGVALDETEEVNSSQIQPASLRRIALRSAVTLDGSDGFSGDLDSIWDGAEMLMEPEFPLLQGSVVDDVLAGGQRFVVPDSSITLRPAVEGNGAAIDPLMEDAFGQPSRADLEQLDQVFAGGVELPPIEPLLGSTSSRADPGIFQPDDYPDEVEPLPQSPLSVEDHGPTPKRLRFDDSGSERLAKKPWSNSGEPCAPMGDLLVLGFGEAEGQPVRPQKRARKAKWDGIDVLMEIPEEKYNNPSRRNSIAQRTPLRYDIFLPHMAPMLNFTTSFSDVRPELLDFPRATAVNLARRQAFSDARRTIPLAPWSIGPCSGNHDQIGPMGIAIHAVIQVGGQGVGESPAVPGSSGGRFEEPFEPSPSAFDLPQEDSLLHPSGAAGVDVPQLLEPESPALSSVHDLDLDPQIEAPATFEPLAPFDAQGDFVFPDLDQPPPVIGSRLEPLAADQHDIVDPFTHPDLQENVGSESDDELPLARAEQLQELVRDEPEVGFSFSAVCSDPPCDVEEAARLFVSLLAMNTEGTVCLRQSEPYTDIIVSGT